MENGDPVLLELRVVQIEYDREVSMSPSILRLDAFSLDGIYVVLRAAGQVYRTACLWDASADPLPDRERRSASASPRQKPGNGAAATNGADLSGKDADDDDDEEGGEWAVAGDPSVWNEAFSFHLTYNSGENADKKPSTSQSRSPGLFPLPGSAGGSSAISGGLTATAGGGHPSVGARHDSILGSGSLLPAPAPAGGASTSASIFSAPPGAPAIAPIQMELWRSTPGGEGMIARYSFDVETELLNYNLFLQLPLDSVADKTLALETPIGTQRPLGLKIRAQAFGLKAAASAASSGAVATTSSGVSSAASVGTGGPSAVNPLGNRAGLLGSGDNLTPFSPRIGYRIRGGESSTGTGVPGGYPYGVPSPGVPSVYQDPQHHRPHQSYLPANAGGSSPYYNAAAALGSPAQPWNVSSSGYEAPSPPQQPQHYPREAHRLARGGGGGLLRDDASPYQNASLYFGGVNGSGSPQGTGGYSVDGSPPSRDGAGNPYQSSLGAPGYSVHGGARAPTGEVNYGGTIGGGAGYPNEGNFSNNGTVHYRR